MSAVRPTLELERELAASGCAFVAGFDEVGRGSLAGPVMVGCAMVRGADLLGEGGCALAVPEGVADSKLLTEHRREAIFGELSDWAAAWAIGEASNAEIDDWGIGHALGVAALRALACAERRLGLDGTSDARVGAILDGPHDYITKAMGTFDAPFVPVPAQVTTKVKGDRHCASVAAAAVLAKVTRDRLMVDLARSDPRWAAYEWDRNKGYGTAAHRAAIAEFGPSPWHRVSWKLT